MNVFLSWSGETSRLLAQEFSYWLPAVVPNAKPFFSKDDIERGRLWQGEVNEALNGCKVGVLFITKENHNAPWLIFEAGAMFAGKRVCPIFFNMSINEAKGPLAQIQGASFAEDEVRKVVDAINSCIDAPLVDNSYSIESRFQKHWPDLETRIKEILAQHGGAGNSTVAAKDTQLTGKSWEDILNALKELHDDIEKRAIQIDFIVSFAGGGLIAADLLHVLHRPDTPVLSCDIQRYDAPNAGAYKRIYVDMPLTDRNLLQDKSILLIDDVVNSGYTIAEVKKSLEAHYGVKSVYVAVLGKAQITPLRPHFSAFDYDGKCRLPYGIVPRNLPAIRGNHQIVTSNPAWRTSFPGRSNQFILLRRNHVRVIFKKEYAQKSTPAIRARLKKFFGSDKHVGSQREVKVLRLEDARYKQRILTLKIGPASYDDYIAFRKDPGIVQAIPGGHRDRKRYLPNVIGNVGLLLTSDGHSFAVIRSEHVSTYNGYADLPGGHPELNDSKRGNGRILNEQVRDELFQSVISEVVEDLRVPAEELGEPRLFSILLNTEDIDKPDMAFLIKTKLSTPQVYHYYRRDRGRSPEVQHIIAFNPFGDLQELSGYPMTPIFEGAIAELKRISRKQLEDGLNGPR